MSGNRENTHIWQDADVRIDFTMEADEPSDLVTPYPSGWQVAGILDGGEGFEEERDEDTSEHYGWGGVLIRKTRSKHKRTIKFVAMEDNAVTFRLRNPGSTRGTPDASGVTVSKVKVPKYEDFRISFETRDGDQGRRRTALATLDEFGTIKESEEEPTVYEFTVVLYPDETDGTLYTEISGPLA